MALVYGASDGGMRACAVLTQFPRNPLPYFGARCTAAKSKSPGVSAGALSGQMNDLSEVC